MISGYQQACAECGGYGLLLHMFHLLLNPRIFIKFIKLDKLNDIVTQHITTVHDIGETTAATHMPYMSIISVLC